MGITEVVYLKLPSRIKGWLSAKSIRLTSPEEIMNQYIATGKTAHLSLLVEEFNGSLFHYVLSQSDKATAEDVVQSTWVKVMKTQTRVTPTHIKSWLFTIARNTLIDELRRQNKWQNVSDDSDEVLELVCTQPSIEKQLQNKNRQELFNKALLDLPLLQREAFIFQQEGFSISEICELTHTSHETVKSRLRYARTYLKNTIGTTS